MTHHALFCALLMICGLVIPGVARSDAADSPQQLKAACEKGKTTACINLGVMYENGGDYEQAVTLYRKLCGGKNVLGCTYLANTYHEGHGVEKDEFEAAALDRKACESGYPRGCENLAWAYLNGSGVPQDEGDALSYYRKGCELRDRQSCQNYSLLKKGKLK